MTFNRRTGTNVCSLNPCGRYAEDGDNLKRDKFAMRTLRSSRCSLCKATEKNCFLGRKVRRKCLQLLVITFMVFLFTRPADAGNSKLPRRQFVSVKRCLANSNEVGCDTFECVERADRCQIFGMKSLCLKFTRKGGLFTKLGKRFVKRSLRCMTSGIKAGFSSWGRQCRNIEKNIARVQSDCYLSHNICDIAASNHETLTAVLSPSDVLNERPSLRLFQSILSCSDKVAAKFRDAVMSVIGQSFLTTLHYMQEGTRTSLLKVFGDPSKWAELKQLNDEGASRR